MSRLPLEHPTTPRDAASPAGSSAAAGFERLDAEALEDRRLRRAIAFALLFHAGLFLVQLPRSEADAEVAPPAREVFVLRETRYRPPEPDRPRELPEPRKRRLPMPDPTPDAPEPLREVTPETFEIPMPADVVIGVPERAPEPIADPAGPVRWRPGIVRPVRIGGPDPQYSEVARRAHVEGVVVLEAVIDVEGRVRDVVVLKALSFGLSEEAVRAVEQWRYEPATLDGRPVAVILSLTVRFGLE